MGSFPSRQLKAIIAINRTTRKNYRSLEKKKGLVIDQPLLFMKERFYFRYTMTACL